MIPEAENEIKPPLMPLTLKLNGAITDFILERWAKKHLPAYKMIITSGYRSPEKNKSLGGAQNSAHLHDLARDIVLEQGGTVIPQPIAEKVFNEFVKPSWPGFALFEPNKPRPGVWHYHLNLSRAISTSTGLISGLALGFVGWQLIKNWGNNE